MRSTRWRCVLKRATAREPFQAETFRVADAADLRVLLMRMHRSPLIEGATPSDRAVLATIISELGTNILKYADRGRIRLVREANNSRPYIDVWAEDDGPGIADLTLAMQDHFTTGRSLGLGLPAARRLADVFEIESKPGAGTRVRARKYIGSSSHSSANRPTDVSSDRARPPVSGVPAASAAITFETSVCSRPLSPHPVGGDIASWLPCDNGLLLVVADVTGHGDMAYRVAVRLPAMLSQLATSQVGDMLRALDHELRGSAGAAVGVLFLDPEAREFRYAGVGNTGVSRVNGSPWRGVSRDGVVGLRMPDVFEQYGALQHGDRFVLWTDGVDGERIRTARLNGLTLSADELSRDIVAGHGRAEDDALAVVVGWPV